MKRDGRDEAYFTLAPDWICEVLDRSDKMSLYAREKIGHAWLVDPIAKTLEVYRRADGEWLRVAAHGDDAKVRAEPFEALELDLAALWTL